MSAHFIWRQKSTKSKVGSVPALLNALFLNFPRAIKETGKKIPELVIATRQHMTYECENTALQTNLW